MVSGPDELAVMDFADQQNVDKSEYLVDISPDLDFEVEHVWEIVRLFWCVVPS